jgi:hypothetical protein
VACIGTSQTITIELVEKLMNEFIKEKYECENLLNWWFSLPSAVNNIVAQDNLHTNEFAKKKTII